MNILITNDDGIHAKGLWTLVKSVTSLGKVTVVAPDRDQSGVGMAMTLQTVVRTRELDPSPVDGVTAYAIQGTPADCVIIGMESLLDEPPDILISGINEGANLGMDIMVSGTVGAAFQGYFRGIPSIAISVASINNVRFEEAGRTAKSLAKTILHYQEYKDLLLCVNLPNNPIETISGVKIAKLGPRLYLENVESGSNGRTPHFWIKHNKPTAAKADHDTDVWAIRNRYISIVPITNFLHERELPYNFNQVVELLASDLGLSNALT